MDLNRAAIFVRVVDQGGFTAAARILKLPKSSVSRAVTLLEEDLGVRLLQRSTRKMRLTEAGSAFYDRTSRGIAAMEEAAAAVADMHEGLRGVIRMTAPGDAGVWLLEPLIARFVREHRDVHIEMVLTGRVVDMVDEGFDLAFRAGRLRDTSLIARKLPRLESALFASAEYLARRGTPKRVAELAKHDCIPFRATRGRVTWTLTGPRGAEESVEVTGPVSADDFSYVRAAVQSGVGIGLLPSFLSRSPDGESLVRVLPEHALRGAPLHLVYPSSRYLTHRVTVFRDFLLQAMNSPTADDTD